MTKQPLATRMRPKQLNDVVGQSHIIGDGKLLTRMVQSKQLTSIILYGKPGIGKTSIAHALANELFTTSAEPAPYEYFNAGVHTKKDLQTIIEKGSTQHPILVFVDEVHRLDKTKQDYLLMHVEDGSIIMIGATTENPYMSVNPAMRSRSRIIELHPVTPDDVVIRMKTALHDVDNGLGNENVDISNEYLTHIAESTNGDVRAALNALELIIMSTAVSSDGIRHVTLDDINVCLHERQIDGDSDGDSHYNLLSAFQKSIRGSDTDASLHYLARLIKIGDLVSIVRRLQIIAYEDIGLVDPQLVQEVYAATNVAERTGFPEARIPLSYITIRLALSSKSNTAYKAIDNALQALDTGRDMQIPKHLNDAHYKGAKHLQNGVGYKYPHDYPYAFLTQQYMPSALQNDQYLNFRDKDDIPAVQSQYKALTHYLHN